MFCAHWTVFLWRDELEEFQILMEIIPVYLLGAMFLESHMAQELQYWVSLGCPELL